MPELPVEIWLRICRVACTDDGTTARALSAVSRQIRAATADYHYRVVAVNEPRQALKLFKVQQSFARARQICHLYLGDSRNYASGLSVQAMPRPSEEVLAIHAVLVSVAQTLETLTIVSNTSRHIFTTDHITLDDLQFPRLSELTLLGRYSLPLKAKFAPNLTRLHISCDVLQSPFTRLLAKFHSRLTHLRISRLEHSPHLDDILQTLCNTMGLPCRKDEIPITANTNNALPPRRFILVEPGPGHWIGPGGRTVLASMTERELLCRALNDKLGRIVVLPPCPGHSRNSEACFARSEWIDRINGGLGCWVALNTEKTVLRCLSSPHMPS